MTYAKLAPLVNSQAEFVERLISLYQQGISVADICNQYSVPPSTFYYWLARYQKHQTYKNLSSAPHKTHRKVTDEVKEAVLEGV